MPPPRTTWTSSSVIRRRRIAAVAIDTTSSAWRSTIDRATVSPSAAASNTNGGSSAIRLTLKRPKYIASMTCLGRRRSKWAGTALARDVRSPRPSSDRTACQIAVSPMSAPPPQSPAIHPSAGKRYVRPSGATAEQLVPNPQTTPTPQVRLVPARSTANVSLRRIVSVVHLCGSSERRILRSSAGRSAPARQNTPSRATGRSSVSIRASRHAASTASPIAARSPARWPSVSEGSTRALPAIAPSRSSRTASIFDPPPSIASTAGRLTAAPRARRS
jgi:hypothetical protein